MARPKGDSRDNLDAPGGADVEALAQKYGNMASSWKIKRAKAYVSKLAEKCHVAYPLQSVDVWRTEIMGLSNRQILALRLLADKTLGVQDHNDVAVMLKISPKTVANWTIHDDKFRKILMYLTTGYSLTELMPDVVNVIKDGLNRRYLCDVYAKSPDGDDNKAMLLHREGDLVHDATMAAYVREAKSLCDIPTDIKKDMSAPTSDAEKEQARRALTEYLQKPEVKAILQRSIRRAEVPDKEITPVEELKARVAATEDGELVEDDGQAE